MTTTTSQAVVLQELIAQATQDLEEIAGHVTLLDTALAWNVNLAADALRDVAKKVRWLREQSETGLFGEHVG